MRRLVTHEMKDKLYAVQNVGARKTPIIAIKGSWGIMDP